MIALALTTTRSHPPRNDSTHPIRAHSVTFSFRNSYKMPALSNDQLEQYGLVLLAPNKGKSLGPFLITLVGFRISSPSLSSDQLTFTMAVPGRPVLRCSFHAILQILYSFPHRHPLQSCFGHLHHTTRNVSRKAVSRRLEI